MNPKGYRLRHVAAATAVVALLVGGGVAYAATSTGGNGDTGSTGSTPAQTQNDPGPTGFAAALAAKLGLETSKVEAALDAARQAATSRDTFVSALASELGVDVAKVEAALEALGPPTGQGPGAGHGPGPGLGAAASYLGMSESALGDALQSGKTLAQIATAKGKSVEGLVDALVADATDHIQQDVKAGNLTQSQATAIISGLKAQITEMVKNAGPGGGGPGSCNGGPPADFGPPADGWAPGGTAPQQDTTNTL